MRGSWGTGVQTNRVKPLPNPGLGPSQKHSEINTFSLVERYPTAFPSEINTVRGGIVSFTKLLIF